MDSSKKADSIVFSPDSNLFLTSSVNEGIIRLWNSHSGDLLLELEDSPVDTALSTNIGFAPDGNSFHVLSGDISGVLMRPTRFNLDELQKESLKQLLGRELTADERARFFVSK
jgi:WD40 repeat protein